MLELFKRMWVGWQGATRGILVAQNAVLMTVAYVLGLGPVALAWKVMRRSMLDRAPADPKAASYWRARKGTPMSMDEANRPF